MTIPAIESYPLPGPSKMPVSVAQWRLDPSRAVLLLHDMQQYFLDKFPAAQSPVVELIENAGRIRDACGEAGIPVVYTAQPGGMTKDERGLLADFWGPGMRADEADRRIADRVVPAPGDRVFVKWRYSAFFNTGLLDFLREAGRDQLIICGVYAHVGCLITACDAFSRDIAPFLVADAVADFNAQYHQMALSYAAERAAVVVCTGDVLASLAPDRAVIVEGVR